jgi:hypothetical protein
MHSRHWPQLPLIVAGPIEDKPPMPKKPETNPKGEFAFFNVVYEDEPPRAQ